MPERIEWLEDGTPYSPRFGDRYRSESGGLDQAREVFLKGCGLPAAWAGQPQWCVLETGFGLGLNFLVTWQAWKTDPLRPRLLHFVSTEAFPASAADVLRSVQVHPELLPLARQLHDQLWGLLPGFHRLVFEEGRVMLTLCIGDAKAMLREQSFEADSVYLDGFNPGLKPADSPDIWDLHTFKAVARCCRRGTRVATWTVARSVRDALAQCGFVVKKTPGIPPKRDNLQGEFNPAWEPKKSMLPGIRRQAGSCVVIGAGLAGAAVAASLARRGWRVVVLDAADAPARGASGLPAGVLAPHVSPDDSLLSRLSRSGVRATLQQAHALLDAGTDWNPTGVLEHCVDHARKLPAAWQSDWAEAAQDWTCLATSGQLAHCRLPASAPALWHVRAGWIKPASLVQAWLTTPGVEFHDHASVGQLIRQPDSWQVLDANGHVLACAELVVLAAGYASRALAEAAVPPTSPPLALQAIRGQVSWALHPPGAADALPAFPVNGHGSLIPALPLSGNANELAWVTGSTFERDNALNDLKPEDDSHNLDRLRTLLPDVAPGLTGQLEMGQVKAWAGVRCATPSRLPALGPLAAPNLWVCSGMGSRGLTFAALCAELLAARLHAEPLPLEQRLAEALRPQYGEAKLVSED
ncbi:bifunctional tRNA (5-methylaminomethyl-2-thiouridine)(34)-methyltransferase MnmD/FAD-dependent 5-carboxymethylaminomethyl-2-thiouridine(34) oxidoreductase MnmC [Polaromonas sp. JS666]|uniref:tRNA 5-methylaminomethyl-2-thiouridine biosynthesis bifunctional protein MnmC n=1 Tax=Polaromonas sp. (strain JS666 / ATCC BAA-500) TaxID=296591 RepID=MNMC_POLSJ|nr:bifunctional tRNA (5-methylaminomethyl-2-thiouridine)(34)-methyltransferase MnmD/FAD-dependent 5-carboxymethylaminomethyl-2-thiouridine(34) oxidoreductase MnmC [Polaromonas sp. JS666]Q12B26.1 RecName: Full=tRNA 5-methylaminomethyl-2-thiouridine biosynthesis bifunctional protein MnmC; Short=tRNA mnm(5)s(2)U biosynthesis bifunctional protein; Includes: RecName: Full=tRNA (mnm(5)s(2)U34)-methyltransferase; Includes: RecName: Full=FAD-dependent cmnm(5)s(2)U34 oxidoreductase [Polaromonas sp. JS666]